MKDCGTQVVEHNVSDIVGGRLALHSQNDKIHIRSDQIERQMYHTTILYEQIIFPCHCTEPWNS